MARYHHVFFDLDGTITDSSLGIINSVQYALEKLGLPPRTKKELEYFIGPPLLDSFVDFIGLNETDAQKAVLLYREYYAKKGIYENKVYDEVENLLKQLHTSGKKLYIATSKPEVFAKLIITHFGLNRYFTDVYGASLDASRSKKADVLRYGIESSEIKELDKTVMIGDREHDMIGGKENHVATIGVTYGFGSRKELEETNATFVIDTPLEILPLVYGANRKTTL
ncbi:MAG: HAD family hydrolase [Lactobacillales bacterium]|jgi:phosphoglycolate phosphatase|nr:HAD family hydrolase [Lactobacillales bacterium]